MGSYIKMGADETEADFVNKRNAYLYGIWLATNEADRAFYAAAAKANRAVNPEVEFLADDVLWTLLTVTHGAVKTAAEMFSRNGSDKHRALLAEANEMYFVYRHEHDYRQAQGC